MKGCPAGGGKDSQNGKAVPNRYSLCCVNILRTLEFSECFGGDDGETICIICIGDNELGPTEAFDGGGVWTAGPIEDEIIAGDEPGALFVAGWTTLCACIDVLIAGICVEL